MVFNNQVELKAINYREFTIPNQDRYKGKNVIFLVNVKDLPDNISLKANPRNQNLRTKIAKKIEEGLLENLGIFHLLNRGITISAENIEWIPSSRKVKLTFTDKNKHGIIDGGHTYRIILQDQLDIQDDAEQFVRIEVMTGVEDFFEQVATSRNSSVQVTDLTIAELEKKYEYIKEALKKESYFNRIAFKQNDPQEIDIIDILKLMYIFNIKKFNKHTMPAYSAYSSNEVVFKDFKEESITKDGYNEYIKIAKILPQIIDIYDLIEREIGLKYIESVPNGKYGSIKGVEGRNRMVKGKIKKRELKSKYHQEDIEFKSPYGFIYPIVASFRVLLEKDANGEYSWAVDPKQVWEANGKTLVQKVVERSRTLGNNPQSTGKDKGLWEECLSTTYISLLENKNKWQGIN